MALVKEMLGYLNRRESAASYTLIYEAVFFMLRRAT